MNAALPFVRIVRDHIHECAPDDCIETITVGTLRKAADAMEGLYEALAGALKVIESDGLTYPRKWDAALAKARGQ